MSSNDKKGNFVQFPLCLLAMERPLKEILDDGISYAIHSFMNSLSGEYDDDAEKFKNAQRTLGFGNGCVRETEKRFRVVQNWTAKFQHEFHKTAFVRIPTTYAFEMRNGEWSENEARVYLAIASSIGQKDYARLGWEFISLRAAGLIRETPKDHYRGRLTRAQVDYAAGCLTGRNALACFTLNRGVRYWSFPSKCSREQIARHVLARRLKRQNALGETDAALTARITAELTKKNS